VSRALDLGYPIFSRGRYMRTGKDRVEVENQGAPISLGEVQVRPGDVLVGDADGILVIPGGRATEVFDVAREIEDAEQAIERETAKGTRLDEARRVFRYHQLQTHSS
jgi:regulator of RNase E activity RraA